MRDAVDYDDRAVLAAPLAERPGQFGPDPFAF
jgi:hypothetical protein